MMLVTCIVPTYRQFHYLFETIDSVLNQTYESIELIITDDASENFDAQRIIDYINANKRENIVGTEIIHNKDNLGTVRNMNAAIHKSHGDIIIPLASDDKFYSNVVISQIVSRFIETKCNVLVCSRLKCTQDMSVQVRLMPHPGYVKYIDCYMNTANRQYVHMAMKRLMEFASGSAMYYRKSFFEQIGGYNEEYLLWEDGPFLAKVTREGHKIETAYDIISIYYRDGGISSKKSKQEHIQYSKIYVDYCNALKNEYLQYEYRFTNRQIRILIGQYRIALQEPIKTFEHMFIYFETIFNDLINKVLKFMYRYVFR